MITHIVAFRLLAATAEQRRADISVMRQRLEALTAQIDDLGSLILRADLGIDDSHWHCVLVSQHADAEGLAAYQSHPAHRSVAESLNEFVESRAIVDFVA